MIRVAATAALLLSLVAALGAPGSAQESFTPEELIARSRAASGFDDRPADERELWNIRVAGLDGTLETVRRGSDVASSTTLGPFRTAHGIDRGQRWHQNENGETIVDRPEPSQAERVVTQSVTRVREPVDAWEMTTTYASGHTLRSYYDPHTYYLVRTDRTKAGITMHTTYDDFRTDPRGHTRPWHYFGGDDRAANGYDYRLLRDDTTADIGESEVAVPHDRRTLVEFPGGIDTVRLPARVENDRIYVRLQIGGRGLDFLLDTGAAALTIDQSVARELGLAVRGRATQTAAGSFESGRVVAPTIEIGALTMHDVVLRTVPLASHESRGTRIVGLLGFDFLDAVGLKIDYAAGTVDALRPGSLVPPQSATPLDVRLNSGTPVARATIGEAGGNDFILDTGAAFSYVVFQRFARAHPEAFSRAGDGQIRYGSGVGGAMAFRPIEARKVGLGTWSFEGALGVEATAPSALGFDNEDGLIGADILKLFTLYVDYAGSKVYLAPNVRMRVVEATSVPHRTVGPRR